MCAGLVVCGWEDVEEDVEDRKYYIVFNFRFCSQFQTRYEGIILRLRFYGPTQGRISLLFLLSNFTSSAEGRQAVSVSDAHQI